MFLRWIVLFLAFNKSYGKLTSVEIDDKNKDILSFVKRLVNDFNEQSGNPQNVAVVELSDFEASKQPVHDLYDSICRIIPKTTAVLNPPINKTYINQTMASNAIIVSDVFNSVSKIEKA